MAVEVLNCNQNRSEWYEDNIGEERPALSSLRRVFVQTDSGDVLGMQLDRRDNALTVKRKVQLALNVPADESSLTFGDMILKNDLAIVPRDSQLRLTKSVMHRSSSSPCLSPSAKSIPQWDEGGGIIQVLGHSNHFGTVKNLVKEMIEGIENGVDPFPISSGLGGVYYFRNCEGKSIAIVKPTDEEPYAPNNPKGLLGKTLGGAGLKGSVRIGETGYREVAAYLLDYDGFARVPPTALVKISHSIFNVNDSVNGSKIHNKGMVHKIASLQKFIPHDFDASDHGTCNFPVAAVHRIGILDIRIFNTDRHAGNILVKKLDAAGMFGQVEITPIDHGLCLPESLEDPYFEWIHWPQASIPFSIEEHEYIKKLDPSNDCEMLRTELPMIREACLRILVLSTIFLKDATAYGLCLAEIGEMMSRQYISKYEEEPSELELVCLEAKRIIEEMRDCVPPDLGRNHKEFQFDMDSAPNDILSSSDEYYKCINSWDSRLELEQYYNEEEKNVPNPEIPKKIDSKSQTACSATATSHRLRRSAEDLHPTTTSFVNLVDLSEKEWILFLDKFKEFLVPAFARSLTNCQNPRQRFGTSCDF